MRLRAVLGDNQPPGFKSLKRKKKKKEDFCSALSQEIKCICSPCLPGQARVDGNTWSLAGPDTLPESQGGS